MSEIHTGYQLTLSVPSGLTFDPLRDSVRERDWSWMRGGDDVLLYSQRKECDLTKDCIACSKAKKYENDDNL